MISPSTVIIANRPAWRMNSAHLNFPYVIIQLTKILDNAKALKIPAYDRLLSFERRIQKFLISYGIKQAARRKAAEQCLNPARYLAIQCLQSSPGSSSCERFI